MLPEQHLLCVCVGGEHFHNMPPVNFYFLSLPWTQQNSSGIATPLGWMDLSVLKLKSVFNFYCLFKQF